MPRTQETITERAASKALYTEAELDRMTDDALDELLSYYQDKGEHDHAEVVQRVIEQRADDLVAIEEDELAHEAEQERQQRMHDEMVDDMLTRDGRWG
jgi:hypothetical protein